MNFTIDPSVPLDVEVGRLMLEECRRAMARLSETGDDRHDALHEVRKGLKRIRALLRLVRSGDGDFSRTENIRYRHISGELSQARDAGALVEAIDRFRAPEGEGRDLAVLRDGLVKRRDRIVEDHSDTRNLIAVTLARFEEGVEAVASLDLAGGRKRDARILAKGLGKNLRRAKRILRQAEKHRDPDDFHELRKTVKDHTMHLELLARIWPGPTERRRSRSRKLGDKLGELNDIAVMRQVLETEGAAIAPVHEIGAFQERMRKKEKSLQRACLAASGRLFDLSPDKIVADAARNYRRARSNKVSLPIGLDDAMPIEKPPLPAPTQRS